VAGNFGPADAGMLLGIGGTLLWATVSRQVLRTAFLLPVTLLMLAGLISGLAGASPKAGLLAVAQDFYLLLWGLAVLNTARDGDSAGFLVRTWCVTSLLWGVSLFVIVGRHALTATTGDTRLAFTADTNGAGLYFVISIFVVMAARWPSGQWWRRIGIAFLVADTVLTGSLGALSGLLAGLAMSLVLGVLVRRGPAPAIALFVVIGLGAASAGLFVQQDRVVSAAHTSSDPILRNSLGRGAQSSAEREQLTKETLDLMAHASLLGSGPNTTETLLRNEQAPYPKQAHNDWIAARVERGVLGFAAVVLLAVEIARLAAASRDPTRLRTSYAEVVPATHFLVGGLVTALIFSLTHEVLHDRTVWTLLGLIAAVAIHGSRPRRPALTRQQEA
jgi:O-antigen ligase